jgi:hypothetical protein
MLSAPGFDLASATSSLTLLTGRDSETTSSSEVRASRDTGAKSFLVSYGSLVPNRLGLMANALSTTPIV